MKRVRCPKCDQYITFDETQYEAGQSLVFKCPDCGKEFGIRMGVSKLKNRQKDENPDEWYCLISLYPDENRAVLKYAFWDYFFPIGEEDEDITQKASN